MFLANLLRAGWGSSFLVISVGYRPIIDRSITLLRFVVLVAELWFNIGQDSFLDGNAKIV